MHAVGILAHSADGAALCFLEMVRESARRLGDHQHPEITLSILPMAPTFEAYRSGDLKTVRAHLARTVQRLADAGCAFFACPDNTAHLALEADGPPLALPGLHIAEIVARAARGYRKVGLLGTMWTMHGSVYRDAFRREGIKLQIPDGRDANSVDIVIFKELCQGMLEAESRRRFLDVIDGMAGAGCEAVALACTEIPLLVTPENSPLPTLDSTRLLAHAAVAVAIGEAPLPTWRGGLPIP